MMARVSQLAEDFFEAFRPPAKLSLSQWADQFARLSSESAAEPGPWHTLPYQRGMMDAATDPAVEQITVMKSARVGYTKMLNHLIGYHIHQDPCPIMLVQPTIEDAEGYSKEEIAPMLRDTPVLHGLVSDAKSKSSENTILQKMFPGGTLSLVGANSPRGFRRVSRRVVLFDEVDGYPPSAGTEGDQIKLGIRRSEYFWNRKIVAGSTPTVKDGSRIERLFDQSDQRRYFVPCPNCAAMQYLKWPQIKWPEGEPAKAYYLCEVNGCEISHDRKRWMVERGEWRATAQGSGKHAGFHIWAAYSYSPNATWGILAAEFLEAKADPESLRTFVNTALGELWEEEYSAKVGADTLRSRAEAYEPNVVPARAVLLTAATDVQDNRLSTSVWAWADGEESWLVSRAVIYGDPARAEVWKQLDSVLLTDYRHESGGALKISAAAIDTGGHFTHEAYAYARERRKNFVIAVKGSSIRHKPAIGRAKKQDVNYRGQVLKSGVELYIVGSDTVKSTIYGRLKLDKPGPGFIHLNAALEDDYFKELTSEKLVTRYVKGFPVREWVKKSGARNEALDEAVYAYAALQWLYMRYHRSKIWEIFEKRLARSRLEAAPPAEEGAQPAAQENVDEVDAEPLPENKPMEPLRKPAPSGSIFKRPRRGGFISNY